MMALTEPVVVEMAPEDAANPQAAALIDACGTGLRDRAGCSLGDSKGASSSAIVIVAWKNGEHLAANIQVGIRRTDRVDWLVRDVAFDRADTEPERWRSVGLIIATLVDEARPAEFTPQASPLPRIAADTWTFESAFALARGAGDAFGAYGPALGVNRRVVGKWFATASFRYETEQADPVHLQWLWGSLGIGIDYEFLPIVLEGRLEPTLAWLHAGADGANGRSGAVFGLRESIAGTWWWTSAFGLSLGGDLLQTRTAEVRLSHDNSTYAPAARAPWLGWSAIIGLRARIPPVQSQ